MDVHTTSPPLTGQKRETENCLEEDIRSKMFPKSQLKSNIPKPVPYIRKNRESRSKSCSSPCPKVTAFPQSLGQRSLSQNSPSCEQHQMMSFFKEIKKSSENLSLRPHSAMTANSSRSQYANVKSKIDTKMPACLRLKMQGLQSKVSLKQCNHLTDVDTNIKISHTFEKPPGDQISRENLRYDDEPQEKERQSLPAYSESSSDQSIINVQLPEADAVSLKKKYVFDLKEGTKNYFLKECASEFLSSFEKQMEEVTELWLELICDVVVTKITIGKSALTKLSLSSPKLTWRDEVTKVFENFPTQGKFLQNKICKIEVEQMNILRVVIQNIVELIKEHEKLKEEHSKMEENYQQTQSRLKEELEILGQENKELIKKYTLCVEMYELERSKAEELENHQIEMIEKIKELRKVVKQIEGKCKELEDRVEKSETSRRELENYIRNSEQIHDQENTLHEDLFKKYAESENNISKLNQELNESENSRTSLEKKVKELQGELADLKATLEKNSKKRTELEEEVCDKIEKMKKLETEISLLKCNKTEQNKNKIPLMDESNLEVVKDLVNDVEQRNLQIQELKKKTNRLEHMLKDKTKREGKLFLHVNKLERKCSDDCDSLKNQVRDLRNTIKNMQEQVSELEKVLGQKTLALDQRDRLIKELKELIRLKNESDFMMCQGRKHHEKKIAVKLMNAETDKESLSRHKKMINLFSLLERKQMDIMKLERRIYELQKFKNEEGKAGGEQKQTKEIDAVE